MEDVHEAPDAAHAPVPCVIVRPCSHAHVGRASTLGSARRQGLRSNVRTVLAHCVPTPLQGGVGTCQQHTWAGVGTRCSNSRFKRC